MLRVRGIDMLDGTPILDVRPYLSNLPPEKLRRGWLTEAEAFEGLIEERVIRGKTVTERA
ncbi:MAG: hypothetical protein DMG85_17630 [Acidobacteria bacterium]|nr:MAG: hypothetical protein DMG85_17630 [Acidobacteriota bacterium]